MNDNQREEQRSKQREYYQRNKEAILAARRGKYNDYYRRRYREKREAILAQQVARYRENPAVRERAKEKVKAWREANPDHRDRWNERYGTEYTQGWRKAHPEKMRRYYKRTSVQKFGITIEQFDAMVEAQGNLCAICGKPETRTFKGQLNTLSIDHNHTTGVVRGLLCSNCNFMVGFAKDSPARLRDAITYLEAYGET
jgi:hypothetical protein